MERNRMGSRNHQAVKNWISASIRRLKFVDNEKVDYPSSII